MKLKVARPQERCPYAIGKLSGNLYVRVSSPGADYRDTAHNMLLLVPGPKNQTGMRVGQITQQEDHHLEWLQVGTKLEIEL